MQYLRFKFFGKTEKEGSAAIGLCGSFAKHTGGCKYKMQDDVREGWPLGSKIRQKAVLRRKCEQKNLQFENFVQLVEK